MLLMPNPNTQADTAAAVSGLFPMSKNESAPARESKSWSLYEVRAGRKRACSTARALPRVMLAQKMETRKAAEEGEVVWDWRRKVETQPPKPHSAPTYRARKRVRRYWREGGRGRRRVFPSSFCCCCCCFRRRTRAAARLPLLLLLLLLLLLVLPLLLLLPIPAHLPKEGGRGRTEGGRVGGRERGAKWAVFMVREEATVISLGAACPLW